jgi:hypothetical protein
MKKDPFDDSVREIEKETFKKVKLAKIPVMVRSNICTLGEAG